MDDNHITEYFTTPAHFLASLSRPSSGVVNSSRTGDSTFTETRNFTEAIGLAERGWPKGTQTAHKYKNKLDARLQSTSEQVVWSYQVEAQDQLDIARYLTGEPEVWLVPVREEIKGKFVHLVYNGGASCGVDSEVIIAKGSVVSALVEALELEGYRVKVTIAFHNNSHNVQRYSMSPAFTDELFIDIKQYEQPLDLDTLTFYLAHPSTFRRLVFKWMEAHTVVHCYGIGTNYGFPGEINDGNRGDLYIRTSHASDPTWSNVEDAVTWIQRQIKSVIEKQD